MLPRRRQTATNGGGAQLLPTTTTTTTVAASDTAAANASATPQQQEPSSIIKSKGNKLDYLDGLRGYASFVVVVYHLMLMFAPAYVMACAWPDQRQGAAAAYNGRYRLPSAAERALMMFFMDGRMAVVIFFVLSGRVLVAR